MRGHRRGVRAVAVFLRSPRARPILLPFNPTVNVINMSKATHVFGLLAAVVLLLAAPAQAQVVYQAQPASKLWIEGTSNKSDWTVTATEFTAAVTMNKDVKPADPGIKAVKVVAQAPKVVSGKSTIMDRLIQDALKAEAHPQITFELVSAKPAAAKAGNGFTLQTRGRLTIGGTTKQIDLAVQGEKLDGGKVRFTGQHELLMSDYGLTPPTAMFGALRTADKATVHFELVVAPGR